MAALSRWRNGRGAHESSLAENPPARPERDVIRASTFAERPEWATLPPLEPLLPPMPWVSSRQFGDSLVSWRPPELFLAPLSHSVSASAPAGVVQGVAIASVEPPIIAATAAAAGRSAADPLVLAIPPQAAGDHQEDEARSWARSESGGSGVASGPTGDHGSLGAGTDVSRRQDGGPPAARTSTSDLVGLIAMAAPAGRLGRAVPSRPNPDSLLKASTPPDMELVQLPSARLHGPAPDTVEGGPAGSPAVSVSDSPAVAPEPLAGGARSGGEAAAGIATPVAPLVGDVSPLTGDAPGFAMGSPETPGARPASQPGAADLTLAATPVQTAPRSGLGAPMADLPPTATSWDITTMSRADQLRTSRAIIQNQIASSPRPFPSVGLAASARREGSAGIDSHSSRRVTAGMDLPLVALERLAPLPRGVAPAYLPAGADRTVPLLSTAAESSGEGTEGFGSESAPAHLTEGLAVRGVIGSRQGVDLSMVPIDRTAGGASEARQLHARGFTSPTTVVIPQHVGTLDAGPGEALLAHELTHVAQQARLGPNLPLEHTPAGRMLEAEALSAEMTFAPGAATRSAPLQGRVGSGEPSASGPAEAVAGASMPLATPTSSGSDPEALAASIFQRLSALSLPGPGGTAPVVTSQSWTAGQPMGPAPAGAGIQRAPEPSPAPAATPATPPAPAGAPGGGGGQFATRPSDEELSNLTQWMYPLISYKLKGELREGRERAGLVTDHYRRW